MKLQIGGKSKKYNQIVADDIEVCCLMNTIEVNIAHNKTGVLFYEKPKREFGFNYIEGVKIT